MEREANRFASELLVPFDWIYRKYQQNPDKNFLKGQVTNRYDIADIAAEIRVNNVVSEILAREIPSDLILSLFQEGHDLGYIQDQLIRETGFSVDRVARYMTEVIPAKIAYVIERKGLVSASGYSLGTRVFHQWIGGDFNDDPYYYYQQRSIHHGDKTSTHWWQFDTRFNIAPDDRSWKELLSSIANDLGPEEGILKFKRIVDGKISGAHSSWITRRSGGTVEDFICNGHYLI